MWERDKKSKLEEFKRELVRRKNVLAETIKGLSGGKIKVPAWKLQLPCKSLVWPLCATLFHTVHLNTQIYTQAWLQLLKHRCLRSRRAAGNLTALAVKRSSKCQISLWFHVSTHPVAFFFFDFAVIDANISTASTLNLSVPDRHF